MTYSSSGPSLAQAVVDRDVDPRSLLSHSQTSSPDASDALNDPVVDRRQPQAVRWNPPSHIHGRHHPHPRSHGHSHGNHARSGPASPHAASGSSNPKDARALQSLHDSDSDRNEPDEDDTLQRRSLDGSPVGHTPGRLEGRQEGSGDAANAVIQPQALVTQVVQTVSLVQIVDHLGSPIELQTHYAPPATVVVDPATGSTISNSNPEPSQAEASPAPNPAVTNNVVPESAQPPAATDLPDMNSSQPSPPPSGNTDSIYVPPSVGPVSDSTPVGTATGATVPSGDFSAANLPLNTTSTAASTDDLISTELTTHLPTSETTSATNTDASTEPTTEATATQSAKKIVASNTTSSYESTSTDASSSTSESTSYISSTIESTISTATWTSTWYGEDSGGGGFGDVTVVAAPPPAATSQSSDSGTGTLSKTEKQVIGGVVGSVAGVAFLALLILLALRYKRKKDAAQLDDDDHGPVAARGLPSSDGAGGSGGGAMAERSGAFAVTAALAGLTGKRREVTPETTPERGFYRVSGRKLPSVLQTGGDGYSDPRESAQSAASGQTDYWRGSQAFEPAAGPGDGGSGRLALGSPMRPISGVPIIRTGPARTPVKEENPFLDPPPKPRPDSDALGDSTAGSVRSNVEGPFGSPSRFKERM